MNDTLLDSKLLTRFGEVFPDIAVNHLQANICPLNHPLLCLFASGPYKRKFLYLFQSIRLIFCVFGGSVLCFLCCGVLIMYNARFLNPFRSVIPNIQLRGLPMHCFFLFLDGFMLNDI